MNTVIKIWSKLPCNRARF